MNDRPPASPGHAATLIRPSRQAMPVARAAVSPAVTARPIAHRTTPDEYQYASFGARVLAVIIDFIILNVVLSMLNAVFLAMMLNDLNTTTMLLGVAGPMLLGGALTMLYSVWLESSVWQATIGKKLLRLKVVDLRGERIRFWRSFSRNAAKSCSALILGVGYLMPLWTQKRQALHDRMVGCVVVRAALQQ